MKTKIIDLIPPIYKCDFVEEICKVLQEQTDLYIDELDIADLQRSPKTASYDINRWADMTATDITGLTTDHAQKQILMKLKGSQQVTALTIKKIIETNANSTCDVVERFNEYIITINIVDIYGVPDNLDLIKDMLRETIPAHLGFTINLKFKTWGDTRRAGHTYTYYKQKAIKWGDLKTLNE